MELKPGWLNDMINSAAETFDSYPQSVKDGLKLETDDQEAQRQPSNSVSTPGSIADSSSVENRLAAADRLIDYLYESGCIPAYEAERVKRYLSGDSSQIF